MSRGISGHGKEGRLTGGWLGTRLGKYLGQGSFHELFLRGAVWTIGGHGVKMAVRLAGNLILTRLLFPEAFGLMALISVFIQALELFSDVGIGPSIIKNERGDQPAFLNTAWTIQVVRGCGLWVLSCLLAWPLARLYQQPMLGWLLPVVGLNAILDGFNSTAFHAARRHLSLGWLTFYEVSGQVLGLAVMIVLAFLYKSVWALVAGGMATCWFNLIVSHGLMRGHPARFGWDRQAARELFHFGRWILLSTALTFMASRGDRLVLGGFVEMKELGLYNIAFFLSQAGVQMIQAVSSRVLFPLYARIAELNLQELQLRIGRIRTVLLAASLPAVCGLAIGGQWLVRFLYDDRWQGAGWMLQVLSIGAVAAVVSSTLEPVLFGVGNSLGHMWLQLVRSLSLLGCMAAGGYLGGLRGVVVGVAASHYVSYVATALAVRRYGVWGYRRDALAFALCGLTIAAGLVLMRL